MNIKIAVANYFAKQSLPAWQPIRIVRVVCRMIYRAIMECGAKTTYPYADLSFAPWEESGEPEFYTAVTDSLKFVIRMGPSYVAWKVKLATGKRLKMPKPGKRKPGENRFDARHWGEILTYNGWESVSPRDLLSMTKATHRLNVNLIGVIENEGEYGQVVWFEGVTSDGCWIVSTYSNYCEARYPVEPNKPSIAWYCNPGLA